MTMTADAPTATRWVYAFGGGTADGDASMRNLLGGKGANLAEMSKLGLPVPPGFTITTAVCTEYYRNGRSYPAGLEAEVDAAIRALERDTGKGFGDVANPLLVSVRSGSRASMPGMMDTVLNLGLNSETVEGLATLSGNRRFALDSYRRFIQMYGSVVLHLPHDTFEAILEEFKDFNDIPRADENRPPLDTDLAAEHWEEVISLYKAAVHKKLGRPFPEDPREQLWGAISAVFASWMNDRAILYRKLHDIPESWGTAVSVQSMVFGNMGDSSATGVAFTRDPSNGENQFYGEFLKNAQGEDVVAGLRTPTPISRVRRERLGGTEPSLEESMPDVFGQLRGVAETLERHYRDMQDIEFTVERGRLYMLQTRNGKRTAAAALKIAVDMQAEGLIDERTAILRVEPSQLDQLLHPTISPGATRDVICKGLPASPGAAVGKIVFDSDKAAEWAAEGQAVILVRLETSPDDIKGMHASRAIVTARGGMTSHAAVVARGMGRPCVCGISELSIDTRAGEMKARGRVFREGDVISIDGGRGEVLAGAVDLIDPDLSGDFGVLMGWADKVRRLAVRANAETPLDVRVARDFGAEGIGLCRTEHMFFDPVRIPVMQEMILSDSEAGRRAALARLLPFQRSDFVEIFRLMGERPCTIRLLDPPLHEFLPHKVEDIARVAEGSGVPAHVLEARVKSLHESNPMLGHRGCRLAISYPEIYEMQAQAIFEAAIEVGKDTGKMPKPEIMIPFVATRRELSLIRERVEAVARSVFRDKGQVLDYLIGTMIELPRAALRAEEIAHDAEFFSFGTNDMTQTALGISRDDAGSFLGTYEARGIYPKDPFVSIDVDGVGELVRIGIERGRRGRSDLKLGVCGEHGGDPASVEFFHSAGLDYVSCSPYRVPIARLAAAHAALKAR